MPKVSIITTTYQHERFIAETIESILTQSFVDWELLIGDDSPGDANWAIIEQYVQKYPTKVRAWHHSPNKGIVDNMNFLLSQMSSNSQYVAFLEGDDLYTPDYLERKLKLWEKYPDLGLVYNELSTIDEQSNILERYFLWPRTRKWYKNETDTIWNFLTSDMVCFSYSTLMVKRYDGMKVSDLWFPGLMWSESDFWLQIASRSNIYGIAEPLTLYRKHQNNTSKSLDASISHFEYMITQYSSDGYINKKEYAKMQILILMMKSFGFLQHKEYSTMFHVCLACFQISLVDTIIIGAQSLYYRLIKPYVFSLLYK